MILPRALALLVVLATGCKETVNYTYFDVKLTLDPASIDIGLRERVRYCFLDVQMPDGRKDSIQLSCARPAPTTTDLGVADFSSTAGRGAYVFAANLQSVSNNQIARGQTMVEVNGPLARRIPVTIAIFSLIAADAGAPDGPPADAAATDAHD